MGGDADERARLRAAARTAGAVWALAHAAPAGWLAAAPAQELRRAARAPGGWWYPALFGALLAAVWALFLGTALADPGYVPRGRAGAGAGAAGREAGAGPGGGGPAPGESRGPGAAPGRAGAAEPPVGSGAAAGGGGAGPEGVDLEAGGRGAREGRRWCAECHVFQPVRAKHCRACGRCVERFDHHCLWLGSCVGRRNHRRFFWLLVAEVALHFWFIRILVSGVLRADEPTKYTYSLNGVTYMLVFFSGLMVVFLVPLLVLHTYLAATGQTTWEWGARANITYLSALPTGYNPFDRGGRGNLEHFCLPRDFSEPYPLPDPAEAPERDGSGRKDTWWDNEHYSCCG